MNEMHYRLPKGSGTITADYRNTARPFIARRYDHLDDKGNARYIYIGSYPTELEAYLALKDASFCTNQELKYRNITFLQLHKKLIDKETANHHFTYMKEYKTCVKRCCDLHDIAYKDITTEMMQNHINALDKARAQITMRIYFRKLDEVADEYGIITKKRSDYLFTKRATPQITRYPLSDHEVYDLLEHSNDPNVQIVLVLLYTGMRNGELRELKKTDINTQLHTITGGFKTPSGTNRTVPIHPRIQPIIDAWLSFPGTYLLPFNGGNKMDYKEIKRRFEKGMEPFHIIHHVPHETRHTFRTRLDYMHANEICIDLLMGHKTPNPSQRIYTHKTLDQLRETIMLLW